MFGPNIGVHLSAVNRDSGTAAANRRERLRMLGGTVILPQSVINLRHSVERTNLESASLKNSSQLQVGARATNGVNNPLDLGETPALGVTLCQEPQRRQYALPAAVNLRQLYCDP